MIDEAFQKRMSSEYEKLINLLSKGLPYTKDLSDVYQQRYSNLIFFAKLACRQSYHIEEFANDLLNRGSIYKTFDEIAFDYYIMSICIIHDELCSFMPYRGSLLKFCYSPILKELAVMQDMLK